jgi:hypothetical protein
MRQLRLLTLCLFLLAGCGKEEGPRPKEPIAVEQVPEVVLQVAREKLPGVNFDKAWKKASGSYEISGTTDTGKVREIEIKADGTVVEVN